MQNHLFLIQAHAQPELVSQIVDALDAPNHFFMIHIDRKHRDLLRNKALQTLARCPHCRVLSLRKVNWGGASQCYTTLDMMRLAMQEEVKFDWFHLVSGNDFPTQSNIRFDRYFETAGYKAYLSFDAEKNYQEFMMERLMCYHFNDWRNMRGYLKGQKFLRFQRSLYAHGIRLRKPLDMAFYKGSNWFSCDGDIAAYMVEYCASHKAYVRRFRLTRSADEMFFHILIMNSPFAQNVHRGNLRFDSWKPTYPGETLPRVLTERDYQTLMDRPWFFFCRKVDFEKSKTLIDLLRNHMNAGLEDGA